MTPPNVERVPSHGDIRVEDHRTVVLFVAVTDAGRRWLREQTHRDREAMWYGNNTHRGLVVAPHQVDSVIGSAREAGLEVR